MADINKTLYAISREEEEKQAESLARLTRLPYVYLVNYPVLGDILLLIKPQDALNYKVVSYLKAGDNLKIATYDPKNPQLKEFLDQINIETKLKPILTVCSETSFYHMVNLYKVFKESKETEQGLNVSLEDKTQFALEIKDLDDLKEKITKVSTTHLLDVIFVGAAAVNASDIHLEPEEEGSKIRYRIDGVLQDIATVPHQTIKTLVSRIKFLANLKIDVNSVPQDGRFDAKAGEQKIDIRVSTLPAAYGDAVVMRLLYHDKEFLTLERLGFAQDYIKLIENAISKPHGIIFNTGPTGSGKTTTLYAVLAKLNKPGIKIITLEDPIEYRIAGIEQTQVEASKNYTFAAGLRSILRHDPDIIMVGEIRDQETAEIAVQAALTGHLVITTLHTNNAPGAIPRLMDIGVRPYLLGGAINLIIAQRLVRLICKDCQGKGCKLCGQTGFHGRTTIAEMFEPNLEIEKLIKEQATLREFVDVAKAAGMRTMYEDGMLKVRAGLTTEEEVVRVTKE